MRFRLHSGAGASSIPREQSSRDIYSIKNIGVNGQTALGERQEGTEQRYFPPGVCPSPVTAEVPPFQGLPAGGMADCGAPRGGEGQGCWHGDPGSCTGLVTLLRLYPDYFQKFESVRFERSIFAKVLGIS